MNGHDPWGGVVGETGGEGKRKGKGSRSGKSVAGPKTPKRIN